MACSQLLALLLTFLNSQLKPSESSRGAAVADESTAVTEATLLNPSQHNTEGQRTYPG